jgi:hypothetical protein
MAEEVARTRGQLLKELMAERQRAYSRCFNADDLSVALVLQDLRKFCRADSSTFHLDARAHALLEGRREVMLRILDYTTLSIDELCKKYGKGDINAE